jgi:colanic acid biosynthesis glycosyl transferase WcaI
MTTFSDRPDTSAAGGGNFRLLIVTQYFWPESFRINDIAEGLKDLGHDVTVLTGIPNYPGGKPFQGYSRLTCGVEDYRGIPVFRTPHLLRNSGKSWHLAINYLSFALSASLSGLLRLSNAFDLIFVYEPSPITVGLPAVILKKYFNIPVLIWVQDLWPESLSAAGAVNSSTVIGMVRTLVRFIYRRCNRILIQSQGFRASIESFGIDSGRILYFPNSAESVYRPVEPEAAARAGIKLPDGFRIVFAGNIGAAQDFDTILAAAEMLKEVHDLHWVVLGDGRQKAHVQSKIAEKNLGRTVHLLGKYPVELMPVFFSLADVLLVTLKRDPIFSLTIPSKIQSYLACAKPIIASLDGEGARIIEHSQAGAVSPPENPAVLAETVMRYYRMPVSARNAQGRAGRQYFEGNFERNFLLRRLEQWMKSVKCEEKVARCAF